MCKTFHFLNLIALQLHKYYNYKTHGSLLFLEAPAACFTNLKSWSYDCYKIKKKKLKKRRDILIVVSRVTFWTFSIHVCTLESLRQSL